MSSTGVFGRVKWFNSRAGYGFVTVTAGDHSGGDVFVHHSSLSTTGELYKYLVEGEYVMFDLEVVENDDHEFQGKNVTGVHGGKLMCETRAENRDKKTTTQTTQSSRTSRPSGDNVEGDEFVLVRKKRGRGGPRQSSGN